MRTPPTVLPFPTRRRARSDDVGVSAFHDMNERGDALLDRPFGPLLQAYRSTGGIERGDDLAHMLRERRRSDVASLAQSIVSHEIFGFRWNHDFWLPMCQFDLSDLSIKPWSHQLLAELPEDLDGWAVSAWLAEPNVQLRGQRPIDLLDTSVSLVLQAARADPFIVHW